MTVTNTQLREPKLEPAYAAPTEPVADIPIRFAEKGPSFRRSEPHRSSGQESYICSP